MIYSVMRMEAGLGDKLSTKLKKSCIRFSCGGGG
jgi:hypothetical protein